VTLGLRYAELPTPSAGETPADGIDWVAEVERLRLPPHYSLTEVIRAAKATLRGREQCILGGIVREMANPTPSWADISLWAWGRADRPSSAHCQKIAWDRLSSEDQDNARRRVLARLAKQRKEDQ